MDSQDFSHILKRVGPDHARKRLKLQTIHSAIRPGPSGIRFSVENLDEVGPLLKTILKVSGLWSRAVKNSIDYQVTEHTVTLPNLPKSFHGFRILHLSDIHIEGIVDKGDALREAIRSLDFDLCVITGDFRLLTYGDYQQTLDALTVLVNDIQCPHGIIGILGNHDFLEMVPGLEKLGIQMLLNESWPVQSGEDSLWIVGLDDAHWYEVADLPKALKHVPEHAVRVLLVHSPEMIHEAHDANVDLYLCGHSHGGQICLPSGIPIIINSRCERKYTQGSWQHLKLQGYTSRGVGSSLLPVRFSCRPEIVLHHLVTPD